MILPMSNKLDIGCTGGYVNDALAERFADVLWHNSIFDSKGQAVRLWTVAGSKLYDFSAGLETHLSDHFGTYLSDVIHTALGKAPL